VFVYLLDIGSRPHAEKGVHPMRRLIRNTVFNLIRADVVQFLEDHEQEMLEIFRQEMKKLDDELPEESLFIDIKIVPLGEEIMRAALGAIKRVMLEL
jgi:hypothetical protein